MKLDERGIERKQPYDFETRQAASYLKESQAIIYIYHNWALYTRVYIRRFARSSLKHTSMQNESICLMFAANHLTF